MRLNRCLAFPGAICTAILSTGCVDFAAISTPQEVPAEIEAVLSDPEAYRADASPLEDTRAGTVIDPVSELDGCWAYYRDREYVDEDGDTVFEKVVEVFLFDAETGKLTWQRQEWDSASGPSWVLWIFEGSYEPIADNRIRLQYTSGAVGLVREDGSIVSNLLLWVNGMDWLGDGGPDELVTVDTANLKTQSIGRDLESLPLEDTGTVRLWVRCE
jgi:hypothetical protein